MEPVILFDETQKYLQALDEFTNAQLVISGSRSQDEDGNFTFQKRDGEKVKIIPPGYTKNQDKYRLLEEEKQKLDTKLQFLRNNLALMKEPSQVVKDNYNDQVTRSEKIEFLLKSYAEEQRRLKELQKELQDLKLQNSLFLKPKLENGKLVKVGSLKEIGEEIQVKTKDINKQIDIVFANSESQPLIYEIGGSKIKIPETDEGVKLKLDYEAWKKKVDEYTEQLGIYKTNLKKIEKIETEILELVSITKFNLEEGTPNVESSRPVQKKIAMIKPKKFIEQAQDEEYIDERGDIEERKEELEQGDLEERIEEIKEEEKIAQIVGVEAIEPQALPVIPKKPVEKKKIRIIARKKKPVDL